MRTTRWALTLTCILSGCATQPASEYRPVPPARLLTTHFLEPSPDSAAIDIRRDAGAMNKGCQVRVSLDSKLIAWLRPAEHVTLYPPAGRHVISAYLPGLCGGDLTDTFADAKAGEHLVLRIGADHSGSITIQPTSD
jgi:hypothetical protein